MIRMEIVSANPQRSAAPMVIRNWTSYVFDRNILTPASAFRFTAPGVRKEDRLSIRSGDTVRLYVDNRLNHTALVGVGFIDETDTHGTAKSLEYVVTGRDTIGQLVDNAAVDEQNNIILFEQANLDTVMAQLLKNTRMMQSYLSSQLDKSVRLALSTSPGETKINVLQRYLEFMNGLVWASNDGQAIVDKPNFTQNPAGVFAVSETRRFSNVLEFRVRRNLNQAIRQIVTQLNGTEAAASVTAADTLKNTDKYMQPYASTKVGRSVSKMFSYASGTDTINQQRSIGRGSLAPHTLAREYSAREIARGNMGILDVEVMVEGHFNASGYLYNVDQIYQIDIEDEDVSEPMYVYSVSYEMTIDHGMITRMRLCRKWTICAYADQLQRVVTADAGTLVGQAGQA